MGALPPTTATAAPILTVGDFQWNDDGSGLGPIFLILNYSTEPKFGEVPAGWAGADFEDLTLTLDDGTVETLSILESGTFADPGVWQIFGSPEVQSAELTLTFLLQPFTLTLRADDLTTADPASGAREGTRLIDYQVSEDPASAVPEPGTLMLLLPGVAVVACRCVRRRSLP